MTAEQLNIKINLDIGSLSTKAKQVKKSLGDMGKEIKDSLPKINTESTKASSSLGKLTRASEKVKESIDDIGDEVKESLGGISTYVNKATQALGKLSSSGKNVNVGIGSGSAESATETAAALEDMQGTLDNIVSLNFLGILTSQFKNLSEVGKKVKGAFTGLKKTIVNAFEAFDTELLWGENIKTALKAFTRNAVGGMKQFGVAILDVTKKLGVMMLKVSAAAVAIGGVFSVIQAFRTSSLAKEISYSAQMAGMSTQAYQKWAFVLEHAGVQADELREVVKTLTEAQIDVINGSEEFIAAFEQLGISAHEVASMNQEQLWERTVTALQNVENTTQRNIIAYRIFGEDAAKLTSVFNMNAADANDLANTYDRLGATMSNSLISKSLQLQGSLATLRAAWQGLWNTISELIIPIIQKVVEWLTKAIALVNLFLRAVFGLEFGGGSASSGTTGGGISGATGALDDYTDSVEGATSAVEKLKRTTMGFDELNIVTNPNSSGGSDSGSGSGAGVGGGSGSWTPITDGMTSIFSGLDEEVEKMKKKVEEFMDKWGTQIKIIGAALATLGVTKLLEGLGKALSLEDKFFKVLKSIKKFAGAAIVITLQYTLMSEWLQSYLDGNGFKEYLKAMLTAAIGSGILYAFWGSTGLMIGLGVTAVASLKTVFENGGVKDAESAVVALTGIASALGAIRLAWKKLGLGTLAAEFGKFKAAIAPAATALGGFLGSIGAVFGLSGGAAIAAGAGVVVAAIGAVAGAAVFLKKNWDAVVDAFHKFFDENIVPKFEAMKKALEDVIPPGLKRVLQDIGNAIGDIVKKIGEWFKSVDWLDAIGRAFEVLGGIVVGVVGGAIMGAINALTGALEGIVEIFSGVVEFLTNGVAAIVKLFSGDLQEAKKYAEKMCDGIVKAFKGLYNVTIGVVVNFVKGVIDWFREMWDILVGHSIVPDTINAIIAWFKKLPEKILAPLKDFVNKVVETFKNMWNNIKTWFAANVAPKFTKAYWNSKFDPIRASAAEKLNAVKTTFSEKWNGIKSWFSSNVAPKFTASYWSTKFESIRSAASSKMEAVKTTFKNAWSSLTSWFSSSVAPKFTVTNWTNKFSSIKTAAKNVFNGVISVIETAINSIIKKLNTVSFSIPSWVPKVGGKSFGINLRTISIPRLAEGGIAVSSTLANIGEKGKEAVLPLENNTEWMDTLADKIASRNQAPTKIVLEVDGRELGWASINNINNITKQTGGLKLHIV